MEPEIFIQYPWFALAAWTVVHWGTYCIALYTYKGHGELLQKHIAREGGRGTGHPGSGRTETAVAPVGRTAVRWLTALALLYLIWWLSETQLHDRRYFSLGVGALALRDAVNALHYLRNLGLALCARAGGVSGTVCFSGWTIFRTSGLEFLWYSIFYLALGALFKSWFFYGGFFGCILTGFMQLRCSGRPSKD